MLIKTTLKETKKKGIALITEENITKGQIIYKDDINFDRIIPTSYFESAPLAIKDFIKTYASYQKKENHYYLCVDNARFFNHSECPNTKFYKKSGFVRALKDIKKGKELTSNYREFDYFSKKGDFGFQIV